MDIVQLRQQESTLLSSNNKRLRLYGQAYKEILRKYDQYAKSWLSDAQLISIIAKDYIKDQSNKSQFVKDDDKKEYKIRISAALKLVVNDKMTYENTLAIVKSLNLRLDELTFENVRNIVSEKYYYDLITPENLKKSIACLQDDLQSSHG